MTAELNAFVEYVSSLKGDEKGEAQLFCDRLFRAFGHGGIIEAKGQLEARIKYSEGGTKFADCLWLPSGRPGVLIEMKKKTETNLRKHLPQVIDYWMGMSPDKIIEGAQKPRYVILCNFERFLIYDEFSLRDDIPLAELPNRASAMNFMLPTIKEPEFKYNAEKVSSIVARSIGDLFKYLVFEKKHEAPKAQHFLLQCVVALFSEDYGLLPHNLFSDLIKECKEGRLNTYDSFKGLFEQMASEHKASGGNFKDVDYFNGGLFKEINPIELDTEGLKLLFNAAKHEWKDINPSIFGALFESTLSAKDRHKYGAHFTSEKDISKIVYPTIIRPWRERIEKCTTLNDLKKLLEDIGKVRVLDPACGCGNCTSSKHFGQKSW